MSVPASYVAEGGINELLTAPVRKIVYSHPGEGKTIYWASTPKCLLMVSDPEGTISAASLGLKFSTVQATDYSELQEAYEWLKEDKPDFEWVVWDSLTLFQDRSLADDIMIDAVADNPKQDRYVPSRREYLISMNRIGDFVRRFCMLPYNFGISAHVMELPAPDGDGIIFGPAIQGKGMSSKISGYMNVVGYLHKRQVNGKVTQSMLYQRSGRLTAKNRFVGSTGTYMDAPSGAKFDDAIRNWRNRIADQPASATPTRIRRIKPQRGN